jgi:hypothetical protein
MPSLGLPPPPSRRPVSFGSRNWVWPLPEAITDEILEARLYPAATAIAAMSTRGRSRTGRRFTAS